MLVYMLSESIVWGMDMKKIRWKRVTLGLFALLWLVGFGIVLQNRLAYGTWNPCSLPERIDCADRRYTLSDASALYTLPAGETTVDAAKNPMHYALYAAPQAGGGVPMEVHLRSPWDEKYYVYGLIGSP